MDEIKLGTELEKNLEKQEESEAEKAADFGGESSNKAIGIMILVVLGIFVVSIGGFKLYDQLTAAPVLSIDELHDKNIQGNVDEEEGYVYRGYSVVKVDGLWWTEINRFGTLVKFPLHFGPKEVESIEMEGELDAGFNQGEELYIAIDPDVADKYYTLALSELSFNVAKGIDRLPVGSCTKENYACDNRTIISCENTQGKPVVELALAPGEPRVELIDTCIKISGNEYGIVKAVDRVLYKWYQVME
jgi:hypothetical protein